MKKFCTSLREHTTNVINFEKNKCYPWQKRAKRYHCYFTGKYWDTAHSICNLRFNVLNKIPVVFHNRPNYDHHFVIKEVGGQFECLRELYLTK